MEHNHITIEKTIKYLKTQESLKNMINKIAGEKPDLFTINIAKRHIAKELNLKLSDIDTLLYVDFLNRFEQININLLKCLQQQDNLNIDYSNLSPCLHCYEKCFRELESAENFLNTLSCFFEEYFEERNGKLKQLKESFFTARNVLYVFVNLVDHLVFAENSIKEIKLVLTEKNNIAIFGKSFLLLLLRLEQMMFEMREYILDFCSGDAWKQEEIQILLDTILEQRRNSIKLCQILTVQLHEQYERFTQNKKQLGRDYHSHSERKELTKEEDLAIDRICEILFEEMPEFSNNFMGHCIGGIKYKNKRITMTVHTGVVQYENRWDNYDKCEFYTDINTIEQTLKEINLFVDKIQEVLSRGLGENIIVCFVPDLTHQVRMSLSSKKQIKHS